jgi:hypothetical protein
VADLLPSSAITRIIGRLNLFFAAFGLAALVFNTVGLHGLPDSFIQENAPFFPGPFHAMGFASLALLVPLGAAGFFLLHRRMGAIVLCEIVFASEIVYFVFFWYRWPLGVSPLNVAMVAAGLFNPGLFLQFVTAYPIIGIVSLEIARRRLKQNALPA